MHSDDEGLTRWLEAEADGRLDEAEAAFSGLLTRHAPLISPPPGFAAATVARAVGLAPAPWPGWVRALVVASVVLTGVSLALLQGVNLFNLVAAAGTNAAPLLARFVSGLRAAASVAASVWGVAVLLGQAVLSACMTGSGPIIILSNLGLAIVGFLGLRRLLASQEECW
jgi:hypothetical protein